MRILSTLLIFILSLSNLYSEVGTKANLSPFAELFIMKYKEKLKDTSFDLMKDKDFEDFVLRLQHGRIYVSGLIEVNNDFNVEKLKVLGAFLPSDLGDIKTFQVPAENFEAFTEINGIINLELDMPLVPLLDKVIQDIEADRVHNGQDIAFPVTGKGTIIGIIDLGLDFTHPDYSSRLKQVWLQNMNGNPPSVYGYGNEIKDIQNSDIQFDYKFTTHATHVTGIAAGGGILAPEYKGVAPEAEIVFVSYALDSRDMTSTGMSYIVDAALYIFTYAMNHNKPAAINMSFGNHLGPRDGSSLFSKAADRLSGPGRIFCVAMGNSGDIPLHINYSFSSDNTLFSTEPELTSINDGVNYIEIWGNSSNQFCVNICSSPGNCTDYICTSDNKNETISLPLGIGSVNAITKRSDFNGKSRIFLAINRSRNQSLSLMVSGSDGEINMWNASSGGSDANGFHINNAFSNPIAGNDSMSLNGLGAEGFNVIATGAYTTKTSYTNINNERIDDGWNVQLGEIAPFSSKGPTADDRTKPDISAPGNVVISTLNSFSNLPLGSKTFVSKCVNFNMKNYCYGGISGTSMASPVTAGTIALMLEVNPLLDAPSVMEILKKTARQDAFTGVIDDSKGDIEWGWGKIDAWRAVSMAAGYKVPYEIKNIVNFFPNPAETYINFSIDTIYKAKYEFLITDLLGNKVDQFERQVNNEVLIERMDIRKWAQGIYLVKIVIENRDPEYFKISKIRGSILY